MNRRLVSIGSLLVAVVLFVALNVLAGATLRSARVDLTQNRLYTLTAGSRNIARDVADPIKLRLFFSTKVANGLPMFKSHATRVREMLEEYGRISGGKIKVEVLDPEPFSEAEDQAVAAGLTGAQAGPNQNLYFGIVGTNSTDEQEILPFLQPEKEEFLEYDITRMIYVLAHPKKKIVGIMSWLPIDGNQFDPMTGMQDRGQPWQIVNQIKGLFEVKTVPTDAAEIPADVDVLMVVHPKMPSDRALYAIDQFVLRGGRLLAFVDPNCEADVPPGSDRNPMLAMQAKKNSDLKKLFDAWGVTLVDAKVAADRRAAVRVNAGDRNRPEPVDYVVWMRLDKKNFDTSDAVSGQLTTVNMGTPGILDKAKDATTSFSPLIQTSEDSERLDQQRVQFFPEPKQLLKDFVPGNERLTLAARISGTVKSAFPDGKPKTEPDPQNPTPPEEPKGEGLKESTLPIAVVVVADVDVLTDRFWVQEDRLGNLLLGYHKFADNGDLVLGAIDNLCGSSDLIGVRARGQYARPFTRVEQIRAEAEKKYQAEQNALEQTVKDTQQKLTDLQQKSPEQQVNPGELILTPEQQEEIRKFSVELADAKKQLRKVQFNMGEDIQRLGTVLKFVNIGGIPVVVCVAAVALGSTALHGGAPIAPARRGRDEPEQETAPMKPKALVGLAVVTVVIVLVAVVALRWRGSHVAPAPEQGALLVGLSSRVNDVASLKVVKGKDSFTIQRAPGAEGAAGGWVLVERGGYPVKFDKVKGAVVALANVSIVEPKTSNLELYPRIGVEDPDKEGATSTLVTLNDAQGKALGSIIIGKGKSSQSFVNNEVQVYARRSGESQSWLVKPANGTKLEVSADPMEWVDRDIISIAKERVKTVTTSTPPAPGAGAPPSGTPGEVVVISRDKPEDASFKISDVPAGRELKFATVADAPGTALSFLTLDDVRPMGEIDFTGGTDPAAGGVATCEFKTFDGLTIVVTTVKKDGKTWARVEAGFDAAAAPQAEPPKPEGDKPAGDQAKPEGETPKPESPKAEGEAPNAEGEAPKSEGETPEPEGDQPKPDAAKPDAAKPEADKAKGKSADEVRKEVETINAKVGRWAYAIPDYKAKNFTTRMEDLLKPLPGENPPPPPEGVQPIQIPQPSGVVGPEPDPAPPAPEPPKVDPPAPAPGEPKTEPPSPTDPK